MNFVQKSISVSKKMMSLGYRGKEIFKPLNIGWSQDLDFAFAHRQKK